ncbi:MAG: hypothetical protein AAF672_01110 [Pseudomonadota bacterium]
MTAQGEVQEAQHDLKNAIAGGKLSPPLQQRAEALLQRIERPFRLSIMGLPGSGKSTLLNLLLGANIIPDGIRLPTLQLSHAQTPSIRCTLGDGSSRELDGDDLSALSDLKPAFAQVFLPLPALSRLSMMEVVAGADPSEQTRAIQWASKRTDIALWCSAGRFDEHEEDLWCYAPESIQDHAFLMLTHADSPATHGDARARLSQARSHGQDYFKNILPIGTKSAVAARKTDGSVDKEALRGSGGMALISAILKDVDAARESAVDQAHIFLRQVDFSGSTKPQTTVLETPKPPVEKEKAKTSQKTVEQSKPPVKQPEKKEPQLAYMAESRAAVEIAVEQLHAEGSVMLESLQAGSLDDITVIETCVDTIKWLDEYLSNSGVANDPLYAKTCEVAIDAADLIQLIQLEPGDGVAADALSLMVQLKQDLQCNLAA